MEPNKKASPVESGEGELQGEGAAMERPRKDLLDSSSLKWEAEIVLMEWLGPGDQEDHTAENRSCQNYFLGEEAPADRLQT